MIMVGCSFNVGYTRCDKDKGFWGELCQDALAESIYGEHWREIKDVILHSSKQLFIETTDISKGRL